MREFMYLAASLLSSSVEFILSLSKGHSLHRSEHYSTLCKCLYINCRCF